MIWLRYFRKDNSQLQVVFEETSKIKASLELLHFRVEVVEQPNGGEYKITRVPIGVEGLLFGIALFDYQETIFVVRLVFMLLYWYWAFCLEKKLRLVMKANILDGVF